MHIISDNDNFINAFANMLKAMPTSAFKERVAFVYVVYSPKVGESKKYVAGSSDVQSLIEDLRSNDLLHVRQILSVRYHLSSGYSCTYPHDHNADSYDMDITTKIEAVIAGANVFMTPNQNLSNGEVVQCGK